MKKLILPALLGVVLNVAASGGKCVPLLGETDGTIKEGVLTLYKDSQDPNKVYFMPQSTQISVDKNNMPLFNFAYWGVDQAPFAADAGGYMTLTTHFAISPDEKAALDNYEKDHPNANVALLPIEKSMVGLETTIKGAAPLADLFKEFNFPPFGGIPDAEIGINAELTARGAKTMESIMKKGAGSGIKFDYCYTVQGYGPNLDATITVDMRRVYDYFEAKSTGGYWWVSVSIDRVVEELQEQHVVSIVMNGGDATQYEALQAVAAEITSRIFKPELSASPVTPASTNNVFNLNVSSVHKEELKSETWTWVRRDLVEREFCTAIDLANVIANSAKLVTSED